MIYLERTITIKSGSASIDEPIVLYKGDKNVEIQFSIKNNPFKTKSGTDIAFGQLIIDRSSASSIFSAVERLSNSKVIFVITGDMIDELCECGDYNFQIRLYNDEQFSRATLAPINKGIQIREPICEGDSVDSALVDTASAADGDTVDVFDKNGNYIKTNWESGDIITAQKLNKVEGALDAINNESKNHITEDKLNEVLEDIDLTDYVTTEYLDSIITVIDKKSSPEGIVFDDFVKGSGTYKLNGNIYANFNISFNDELAQVLIPGGTSRAVLIHKLSNRSSITRTNGADYMCIDYETGEVTYEYFATESFVNKAISDIEISGGSCDCDLTGYATIDYVDGAIADIETPDLTDYATKEELNKAITVIDKVEIGFDDFPESGTYKLSGGLAIYDMNGNRLTEMGECLGEIVKVSKFGESIRIHTLDNELITCNIQLGTISKYRYNVTEDYVDYEVANATKGLATKEELNALNSTLGDIESLLKEI